MPNLSFTMLAQIQQVQYRRYSKYLKYPSLSPRDCGRYAPVNERVWLHPLPPLGRPGGHSLVRKDPSGTVPAWKRPAKTQPFPHRKRGGRHFPRALALDPDLAPPCHAPRITHHVKKLRTNRPFRAFNLGISVGRRFFETARRPRCYILQVLARGGTMYLI
jgi:hypothetical protein